MATSIKLQQMGSAHEVQWIDQSSARHMMILQYSSAVEESAETVVLPPALRQPFPLEKGRVWHGVVIPESALLDLLAHGVRPWQLQLPSKVITLRCADIASRMRTLVAESKHEALASQFAIDALARLLLVAILRNLEPSQVQSTWVPLPPRQLREILNHIDANLESDIRLAELAQIHGWSPYYFCRIFKKSTGLTPHQYVLRQRVEKAKNLLGNSSLDLSNVALEAGFANQSHFGTIFRRFTGYTPKQYRLAVAA
jgi:AraC-like DNA-binding protein